MILFMLFAYLVCVSVNVCSLLHYKTMVLKEDPIRMLDYYYRVLPIDCIYKGITSFTGLQYPNSFCVLLRFVFPLGGDEVQLKQPLLCCN